MLALLFRSVAFEPYTIPTGSMKPNLLVGDYIVISKYSYGFSRYSFPFGPDVFEGRLLFSQPERGDVIIFKLPENTNINYIKRLVGLPGDKIQMRRGVLHVNGKALERKEMGKFDDEANKIKVTQYLEKNPEGKEYITLKQLSNGPFDDTEEFIVPEKMYFFMGDNRDNSVDSRSKVGFVPEENIVGKARIIFFSTKSAFWEIWRWPFDIRLDRIMKTIS
jgi:signal peptidase I